MAEGAAWAEEWATGEPANYQIQGGGKPLPVILLRRTVKIKKNIFSFTFGFKARLEAGWERKLGQ